MMSRSRSARPYARPMRHGEFRDPRLVTVYDLACPWSPDDDFFLSVLKYAGLK